jgi:hypothetical protein
MTLSRIRVERFTAFDELDLALSPGIGAWNDELPHYPVERVDA